METNADIQLQPIVSLTESAASQVKVSPQSA
jgi:hypothetical protein